MEGIGNGWNGWFGMVLGLDMKWFLRWLWMRLLSVARSKVFDLFARSVLLGGCL